MANFSNQTTTLQGRAMLKESMATGRALKFVFFRIGDGDPAPEVPEAATDLQHPLFDIPVSKVEMTDDTNSSIICYGTILQDGNHSDFRHHELGIFARFEDAPDSEPTMFGYLHAAGDQADFIPRADASNMSEYNLVLTIAIGSANVLVEFDPAARASMRDIADLLEKQKAVTEKINEFEKKSKEIEDTLKNAEQGYVKKAGDTMTGELRMGSNLIVGNLHGNVTGNVTGNVVGNLTGDVNGWHYYESLGAISSSLNVTSSTVAAIVAAMQAKTRSLVFMSSKNANMPDGQTGLLDIIKPTASYARVLFSTTTGMTFIGAVNGTTWSGWSMSAAVPPGSLSMFAGEACPAGYLFARGQTLATSSYPALFAAIGYTYGGSGANFKLPDTRGMFVRGFDSGRGVDSGRKLGSQQAGGAPNIKGSICPASLMYPSSGAFQNTQVANLYIASSVNWSGGGADFDASRSSSVYQDGLKEVRPINLAVNYIIKY